MVLRTIFNTMHRMVYPFLGTFARGLGVDITALSFALTGRSLVGAFVPFIASVSDQRGRRFGMLAGIALFTSGVALVALWPSLWTLTAAFILALLGKYLFDPAMQAYFGDRIPYQTTRAGAGSHGSWLVAVVHPGRASHGFFDRTLRLVGALPGVGSPGIRHVCRHLVDGATAGCEPCSGAQSLGKLRRCAAQRPCAWRASRSRCGPAPETNWSI